MYPPPPPRGVLTCGEVIDEVTCMYPPPPPRGVLTCGEVIHHFTSGVAGQKPSTARVRRTGFNRRGSHGAPGSAC